MYLWAIKISVKESLGEAIIMLTIYLNKVLCMSAGEKRTGLKLNAFLERERVQEKL